MPKIFYPIFSLSFFQKLAAEAEKFQKNHKWMDDSEVSRANRNALINTRRSNGGPELHEEEPASRDVLAAIQYDGDNWKAYV